MAGTLRQFKVHGSFKSKGQAIRKEQKVGGFIRKVKIHGQTRYVVLTRRFL